MAGQDRQTDRTLRVRQAPPIERAAPADRLLRDGRRFEFFQVLQLLERAAGNGVARPGRRGPAADEAVRLRPHASLAFPPTDVVSIEPLDAGARVDTPHSAAPPQRLLITASFMGLYGSDSPLPIHYTRELLHDDEDLRRQRDFLDIFNHRILSLYYRAWTKYRYDAQFETGGADEFSAYMLSLVGLGTAGLAETTGLPPVRLIRYAGLMTQRPRSATGLAGVLTDFFDGLPFSVRQCVGRWVEIDATDRNRIGRANAQLGQNFSIGERVYDVAGKFRAEVGPIDLETYERFLPEADAFQRFLRLTRLFSTDRLDFDFQLTLRGDEVPPFRVVGGSSAARLGWTSWVVSRPAADSSVVFTIPPSVMEAAA